MSCGRVGSGGATSTHVGLETVRYLATLLARYERLPEEWAADVFEYVEVSGASHRTPESFLPMEMAAAMKSTEAVREATQAACREFGHLLEVWEPICDAARELRHRGIRPTQAIGHGP
jgi:hypothetical protein